MSAALARALLWAAAVRLVLIVYGSFHDAWAVAHGEVKYTDFDYSVFSDGAALVWQGRSPFEQPMYRYTPLLALLLTPTAFVHPAFGKLLFSLGDLIVGAQLYAILTERRVPRAVCRGCMAMWLFNPLSVNVSTRGNAESLTALLMFASLLALMRRRPGAAGAFLAAAIHMKPYPVIYIPAFAVCVDGDYAATPASPLDVAGLASAGADGVSAGAATSVTAASESVGIGSPWRWLTGGGGPLGQAAWRARLAFGTSLLCVYLALFAVCYAWCGEAFYREALLYHFSRVDTQHNFSPYFYPLALSGSHCEPAMEQCPPASIEQRLISTGAFVPQAGLLLYLALAYGRDLPFCLFVQTLVFVTFNKVCTAQYFIWYHALLPLVLPSSAALLRTERRTTRSLVAAWVATLLLWLAIAYLLEFRHLPVHLPLWLASLSFFAANCAVAKESVRMHHATPLFRAGRLARQACLYGGEDTASAVGLLLDGLRTLRDGRRADIDGRAQ